MRSARQTGGKCMRQPQTEEEERTGLLLELGWLSAQYRTLAGAFPACVVEDGHFLAFSRLSNEELGALCDEIRGECTARGAVLDPLYPENILGEQTAKPPEIPAT